MLGQGCVIASDEEFARLRRHLKAYMVVSLPLVILAATSRSFLAGVGILTVLLIPYVYVVWARVQCRRLPPTNEPLTLRERILLYVQEYSTRELWFLEIGSLLFVVGGFIILVADPRSWMMAVVAIVFFGACAVMFGRMLIVKGRASHPG